MTSTSSPSEIVEPPATEEDFLALLQSTFENLNDQCNNMEQQFASKFAESEKELRNIEQALADVMDHSGLNDYGTGELQKSHSAS